MRAGYIRLQRTEIVRRRAGRRMNEITLREKCFLLSTEKVEEHFVLIKMIERWRQSERVRGSGPSGRRCGGCHG